MGSCSSRPSWVADGHSGSHPQHAPMWVIRTEHVLEMKGTLLPHQSLKAQGLLEIWCLKMFVVFVSHQWLGLKHPDPNAEQLKVLQAVLKNLIAKQVTIEEDAVSGFFEGKLTARQLKGIPDWYIWLDYFCVPQVLEQESQGVEDQHLYIKSIPSYVDLCNVFVALVPQAIHHDTRVICDTHSWLERGWCRTELWCYHLSTRSKTPIIQVKGPRSVRFSVPMWHQYPVHLGDFGVESDRAACSQVIQVALSKYVAELRRSNKTAYRLYLSLFEEITGLPNKLRSLEEFAGEFDFDKPLARYKGLGPVACAALAGDEKLLRTIAMAKASLHTFAPAMPETLNAPDYTPLHLALWFKSHDLQVLQGLLELRADPNKTTLNIFPPLGLCKTVAALDLLVGHGAGLNYQGKFVLQYCPVHSLTGFGAPSAVVARLLELRADVNGGRGGLASVSPLHTVAYSGDSKNDLRNAQLLVEHRADVNQVAKPKGFARMVEVISRAYSNLRSSTGAVRFFSQVSTTPLGWSAIFDNHGICVFLLRAQADPEIRGNTGLRPIQMAGSESLRRIIQEPGPHIQLLEYYSESVTDTL